MFPHFCRSLSRKSHSVRRISQNHICFYLWQDLPAISVIDRDPGVLVIGLHARLSSRGSKTKGRGPDWSSGLTAPSPVIPPPPLTSALPDVAPPAARGLPAWSYAPLPPAGPCPFGTSCTDLGTCWPGPSDDLGSTPRGSPDGLQAVPPEPGPADAPDSVDIDPVPCLP